MNFDGPQVKSAGSTALSAGAGAVPEFLREGQDATRAQDQECMTIGELVGTARQAGQEASGLGLAEGAAVHVAGVQRLVAEGRATAATATRSASEAAVAATTCGAAVEVAGYESAAQVFASAVAPGRSAAVALAAVGEVLPHAMELARQAAQANATVGDGVALLNSLTREAKKAYTVNTELRAAAIRHDLPTDLEGPVPFVPPKGRTGKAGTRRRFQGRQRQCPEKG